MKKYDICVVGGAGHVGLPLSISFADRGKSVIIVDKNTSALETIGRGRLPFLEKDAEPVLKRVVHKKLFLSDDLSRVALAEFIVVVVGTPVDEHLNPACREIMDFFRRLKPHLRPGQVVILRSTVYPGTTQRVRDLLERTGVRADVCFCPERIAEGRAMEELYSLPQIISGFRPGAVRRTARLFGVLTKDIIVLEPLQAELAKLFSNSWRYIHFAIANQFYMIAEEYGADFHTIFDAMTYRYPRTKSFPRPGFAAGPCLFKDTMQISAFTNNKFFLGHSAMLVNEGLPNFIVERLKLEHRLSGRVVGVLGMAFKAESDDKRESLSYKLRKILEFEAKEVLCSDEYISDEQFVSARELVRRSDIIIIGVPHKAYAALSFGRKVVVDIWGAVRKPNKRNAL